MSRLYLILLLTWFCNFSFAQQELKKYLEFAKEKYHEGDYVYALRYYDKAMAIDSNSINTLWEYAETLRAYKDYPKATYYYKKVYEREGAELYPSSLLNYGLMLKQTGNYEEALSVFKLAKKKYRKDSKGYLSKKSKAEIESCIWAKANEDAVDLIIEHLPEQINTPDAEFGHIVYNNQLIFSALKSDSIGQDEEVYASDYKTHLYFSEMREGNYGVAKKVEGLNWEYAHSGNGTLSMDGKRFYFSYCIDKGASYQCKILVARATENQFTDIDTLGSIINYENANTTMPFIGEWDGNEVLFYVSDRPDGLGGMDIWYSFIKNGNQYSKPKNVKQINSMDDELSPFWDSKTSTLYFSSSWYAGFGGQDIFKSKYDNGFQTPENLMMPINSPANDIYYFQTFSGDSAYFSSNRLGSEYVKNPTCCSDIYLVRKEAIPLASTIEETFTELNKRLPLSLYFHNDIPNPKSWDTTTNVSYLSTYYDYIKLISKYKNEYALGLKGEAAEDAKDDIEDFFSEYVKQGVRNLNQYMNLLLVELDKGFKIELTVKGFASPLAKSEYNENLAKRRISSLINYLKEYQGGVLLKYIDREAENGGELHITKIPFGEIKSDTLVSDNPNDVKSSIYSRAAARERKIEIQSVSLLKEP